METLGRALFPGDELRLGSGDKMLRRGGRSSFASRCLKFSSDSGELIGVKYTSSCEPKSNLFSANISSQKTQKRKSYIPVLLGVCDRERERQREEWSIGS